MKHREVAARECRIHKLRCTDRFGRITRLVSNNLGYSTGRIAAEVFAAPQFY